MRIITTLCLFIIVSSCFAQSPNILAKNNVEEINILPERKDSLPKPATIRMHCMRTLTEDDEPLIVIDGIPVDERNWISSININDIESINILKASVASAIFGCRAAKGIILITTKYTNQRKFIIKDFLDGNPIAGATISFITYDKKDTIMTAANDGGVVIIDKLKHSVSYEMCVTAIGYKLLNQNFSNTGLKNDQNLLLEREIKMCTEVIIANSGHGHGGCGRQYVATNVSNYPVLKTLEGVEENTGELKTISASSNTLFPNPLSRGKAFTLQKSFTYEAEVVIRITSLDGKLLTSVTGKTFNGLNQFVVPTNSNWFAGIYFVQLYANGKLVASDKLVIQ